MDLSAARSAYRRRERAVLHVAVTQGVAGGLPVRDAVTQVELTTKGRKLKRVGGSTDANGRLVLGFVVAANAPLGPVKAVASATAQLMTGTACEGVLFASGSTVVDPLLTVRS